jgi:hypothetical protein
LRSPSIDPFRKAAQLSVLRMRRARYQALFEAAEARPVEPFVLTSDRFLTFIRVRQEREKLALVCRAAPEPKHIADGLLREYAAVLGDTVAYRDAAPTSEHRNKHEGALSSIHQTIEQWQSLRDRLGLPFSCGTRDINEAIGSLTPEQRTLLWTPLPIGGRSGSPGPA